MKLSAQQLNNAREYLTGCLARVGHTGRLPALRTMLAESGASRTALTKALDEYEANGRLIRRPRIGLVVPDAPVAHVLDIVACHDEGYSQPGSGFLYECILKLIRVATDAHYTTRLHSVGQEDSVRKYLDIAGYADSGGFVLLEPNMREIISTFQQTGKPVAALFSQGRFAGIDQVVDAKGILDLQMRHLFELGHTRILYLREEPPFYQGVTMMARRLEYYNIMARRGLQIPMHWRTEYPLGQLRNALEKAFARDPMPTALIVYDLAVAETYAFLRERGLRIGVDVSVMATDGAAVLNGLTPPVTTPVSHSIYAARSIWSLLEKQRHGDRTPQTMEIMLTFRQGQSTGPAPTGHLPDENIQP